MPRDPPPDLRRKAPLRPSRDPGADGIGPCDHFLSPRGPDRTAGHVRGRYPRLLHLCPAGCSSASPAGWETTSRATSSAVSSRRATSSFPLDGEPSADVPRPRGPDGLPPSSHRHDRLGPGPLCRAPRGPFSTGKEADLDALLSAGRRGAEEAKGRRAAYLAAVDEIGELSTPSAGSSSSCPDRTSTGATTWGRSVRPFPGSSKGSARTGVGPRRPGPARPARPAERIRRGRPFPGLAPEGSPRSHPHGRNVAAGSARRRLSPDASMFPDFFRAGTPAGRSLSSPASTKRRSRAAASRIPCFSTRSGPRSRRRSPTSADLLRGRSLWPGRGPRLPPRPGRPELFRPTISSRAGSPFPHRSSSRRSGSAAGTPTSTTPRSTRRSRKPSGFFPGGPGPGLRRGRMVARPAHGRARPGRPPVRRGQLPRPRRRPRRHRRPGRRQADRLRRDRRHRPAPRPRSIPWPDAKAVMSATRLELLAKCPFGYFLRHVLKVQPPEEVAFDRSRWLDPLQRGSLVHEILCDFMTEVAERGRRRRRRPGTRAPDGPDRRGAVSPR